MSEHKFYPEEELIERMERGEIGWLGFVNHYSPQWQEEYSEYCEKNGLQIGDESASKFVHFKDAELESAMEKGEA